MLHEFFVYAGVFKGAFKGFGIWSFGVSQGSGLLGACACMEEWFIRIRCFVRLGWHPSLSSLGFREESICHVRLA